MSLDKPSIAGGVSGFFVSPFGAYKHLVGRRFEGDIVAGRAGHMRPVQDQKLDQWDSALDFVRLNVKRAKTAAELMAEKAA